MNKLGTIHQESGFTLIELLVVILIIGILAAIAIPMFLNQRKAAAETALRSDMKNMSTHMYTFFAQNPLEDALPKSGNLGWSVIVRDEGALFAGDRNSLLSGDLYPDGMKSFEVSEGVGLGVVTSVVPGGIREVGDFCIVGNHEGSDYKAVQTPPEGTSSFASSLFYDSANGGFFTPEELPTDEGACASYGQRIAEGT